MAFNSAPGGGFGAPAAGGFGAAKPATGGFGAPAAAGGFGAPAPATGGFGAPAAGGFGAAKPATGGFGAPAAAGGFGAPAPATGGFGAPAAGGFGAAKPATGGFGAPAAGGFGAPGLATGGFGAPAAGGFGAARPATGGFGAPAAGGFGATGLATGGFGAPAVPQQQQLPYPGVKGPGNGAAWSRTVDFTQLSDNLLFESVPTPLQQHLVDLKSFMNDELSAARSVVELLSDKAPSDGKGPNVSHRALARRIAELKGGQRSVEGLAVRCNQREKEAQRFLHKLEGFENEIRDYEQTVWQPLVETGALTATTRPSGLAYSSGRFGREDNSTIQPFYLLLEELSRTMEETTRQIEELEAAVVPASRSHRRDGEAQPPRPSGVMEANHSTNSTVTPSVSLEYLNGTLHNELNTLVNLSSWAARLHRRSDSARELFSRHFGAEEAAVIFTTTSGTTPGAFSTWLPDLPTVPPTTLPYGQVAPGGIGAKPATGFGAPAAGGFGAKPATGFGAAPAATGFGAAPAAPAATGFGAAPAAPAATGFGAAPAAPAATGFGAAPAAPAATGFGAAPAAPAATGFGAAPAAPAATGFGAAPAAPAATGFGAKQPAPSAAGFGAAPSAGGFGSTPATAGAAPPFTLGSASDAGDSKRPNTRPR